MGGAGAGGPAGGGRRRCAGGADEATEPAAEAAACRAGHWPAEVQGQPAGFHAGSAAGAYLWHTDTGWHLRVTHPGNDKVVFRGAVTSPARIHGVARRIENGDVVVSAGRHRIGFRFTNYGGVDGVDFRLGCGPGFQVDVSVDGRPLPADHVFVGADGHHPAQVPFRIERQKG